MILRGGMIFAALVVLLGPFAGRADAVSRQVTCGVGTIQAAVDASCSGDTISVVGACTESVSISTQNAGCVGGAVAFTKLTITGGSNASNKPGAGAAFTVMGNAYNITISNFLVGSGGGDGIDVLSAHRVTLQNIRTAPTSSLLAFFATGDAIHIDTASTRARVLSSTLNNNGGDGVENGSTDGEVTSVIANDNELVGIHVPGSNVMVTRCKADENLATGNVQDEGYRFDGPGAIVQQNNAKDNIVAQFHDTAASTGVIHFRNIAGNSSATIVPAGAGIGFWEEGWGNRINTCSVFRNATDGVKIDGSGNALQLSIISSNKVEQVRITGDNNFIQTNTITRVGGTSPFASVDISVDLAAGATANFLQSNRVSITTPTTTGNGYTEVATGTNNGLQNTRAPSDPNDPPANLR